MRRSAIVCTGHDFETLYPDLFRASGVTRCKLQMMRTRPQPEGWLLGPALAAGLTLRFYDSFRICQTLPALERRIAAELAGVRSLGHSRAGFRNCRRRADHRRFARIRHGHRSIRPRRDRRSDSSLCPRFSAAPVAEIAEHWHGVYAKHPDTAVTSRLSPAPNVRVVTATGGSGMTLSFGLAEQTMKEMGF